MRFFTVTSARPGLIPSPSLDSGNPLCYRTPPARPARAKISGRIAQLVEQLTLNQRVPGSSPGAPTNKIKDLGEKRERPQRRPCPHRVRKALVIRTNAAKRHGGR